jgi:hypothetical protein
VPGYMLIAQLNTLVADEDTRMTRN